MGVKSVLQLVCSVWENKVPNKYLDHYHKNFVMLCFFQKTWISGLCRHVFSKFSVHRVDCVCLTIVTYQDWERCITEEWVEQPLCLAIWFYKLPSKMKNNFPLQLWFTVCLKLDRPVLYTCLVYSGIVSKCPQKNKSGLLLFLIVHSLSTSRSPYYKTQLVVICILIF